MGCCNFSRSVFIFYRSLIEASYYTSIEKQGSRQSDTKVFVKKITVNGSRLAHSFVTYKKIAKAGKMIFELAAEH